MKEPGRAHDAHLHTVTVRVCDPEGDLWGEVVVPGTPARVTVALASLAERVTVYARTLPPDVLCAWSAQVCAPDGALLGTFEGRDTARVLGARVCAHEEPIGRLVAGAADEWAPIIGHRRLLVPGAAGLPRSG